MPEQNNNNRILVDAPIEFMQRAPEFFQELKQYFGGIPEDAEIYRTSLDKEREFKNLVSAEVIEKIKTEKRKTEEFADKYCFSCIRKRECAKIGAVYKCALFSKDDCLLLNVDIDLQNGRGV